MISEKIKQLREQYIKTGVANHVQAMHILRQIAMEMEMESELKNIRKLKGIK